MTEKLSYALYVDVELESGTSGKKQCLLFGTIHSKMCRLMGHQAKNFNKT